MLIQRGVHQLQVDEGLCPDLGQELQSLPADLSKFMKTSPVQPRLLADVVLVSLSLPAAYTLYPPSGALFSYRAGNKVRQL